MDDFDSMCYPVLQEDCAELDCGDGGAKQSVFKPECWKVGVCICKGAGLELWATRTRLQNALKLRFRPKSPMMKLLQDRFVVVELHGTRAAATDPWEIARARAAKRHVGALDSRLYFHVGGLSLSPYEPMFLPMSVAQDQSLARADEVVMEAT